MSLTQTEVKALLDYDPETGEFRWKVDRGSARRGDLAGGKHRVEGYVKIRIARVGHAAHRLAWLWMTGEFPPVTIDHRDGDRDNNRWTNLRLATFGENQQNRKLQSNNKSGFIGVSWNKQDCRWSAFIAIDRKLHWLGYFDTPEEASAVYLEAKRKLHEFQPKPRYLSEPKP